MRQFERAKRKEPTEIKSAARIDSAARSPQIVVTGHNSAGCRPGLSETIPVEVIGATSRPTPVKPPWKAKVALIDSGVLYVTNNQSMSNNIAKQIVAGVSFVRSGGAQHPWWNPSVPHGTQMASLICAIDPCCELYVAKVGDTLTSGVTPERVTEVGPQLRCRDTYLNPARR